MKKKGFWTKAISKYQKFLMFSLRYKKSALLLILSGIIWGTVMMGTVTKFQLFPEFDAQQIYMTGIIDINNNLAQTESYVTEVEDALLALLKEKDMDSVTSVIGIKVNKDQSFEVGENLFQIFINLHEKAPENFFDRNINPLFSLEYDDSDMIRHRLSQDIAKEIQEKIVEKFKHKKVNNKLLYKEFNVYVQQAGIVSNDIDIGFEHAQREMMLKAMERVKEKLATIEGVEDIGDNANEGERELKLRVNAYGQSLGFSESSVTAILRGAFFES